MRLLPRGWPRAPGKHLKKMMARGRELGSEKKTSETRIGFDRGNHSQMLDVVFPGSSLSLPEWQAQGWFRVLSLHPSSCLDPLANPGSPWPGPSVSTQDLCPQEVLMCPALPSLALRRAPQMCS